MTWLACAKRALAGRWHGAALRRWVPILLLCLCHALPARADTVTVGWAPVRNYYEDTGTETPSGYWGDLAVMIGEAAGLDIVFRRYPDITTVIAAQAAGEVEMLAGVGTLPQLRASNVYSDPVGESSYQLFVRSDQADFVSLADSVGKTIGFTGSERVPFEAEGLFEGATLVPVDGDREGVFLLLAEEIDGLIAIADPFQFNLRLMTLDHRVNPIGDPLQNFDRVVALHQSRADLLDRVNAAVEELHGFGQLEALEVRWSLDPPAPEPDVLRVGVYHFPPFQVVESDGTLTGFAVEVLRDLAGRANLSLEFVPVSVDDWGKGPGEGGYDLLPQAGISPERARRMDFTLPITESTFSIFVRPEIEAQVSGLDDLAGRRVGVVGVNLASDMAQEHGGFEIVTFPDLAAAVQGLAGREVDAILNATSAVRMQIAQNGLGDSIVEIKPPFHTVPRAVALRFGLGSARERLNVVLPGYLVSDDYKARLRDWLEPPIVFEDSTIRHALYLLAAALCLVALYAGYERRRRAQHQRTADLRSELLSQADQHRAEMADMIAKLRRSNAELDGFAYIASHDLKAPLRVIDNASLWLEQDLDKYLDDDTRRNFRLLRGRVKRMENFLNDLLEHSRIGRVPVEDCLVSGPELMEEVRDLAAVPESFTLDVDPRFETIEVPIMPIRTVLVNLVSNAVKHHDRPDGTIRVRVEEGPETFTFTVEDDGPGIPKEYHERVFQMFQTLKPRDTVEGSGMGLAMVQKTVMVEGGRIDLQSEAGAGARFIVTWPKRAETRQPSKEAA